MNRRGFLLGILAAGTAPAIVQAANIMPTFARRESGLLVPRFMEDLVRRSLAYEMDTDSVVARFDILLRPDLQLAVDQRFIDMAAAHAFGAKARAVEILDKEMRQRGFTWADVHLLPSVPPAAV